MIRADDQREALRVAGGAWAWQDEAACAGDDLLLFFGPDGERQPEREKREALAKEVCSWCPVRTICLDSAIEANDRYGIRGGLNEDERVSERRRRTRRDRPKPATKKAPARKRRRVPQPPIVCAHCGQEGSRGGRGPDEGVLISACYARWRNAGYPEQVPEPVGRGYRVPAA
jgi:WhiB family redox-sensing transcriptional regulator